MRKKILFVCTGNACRSAAAEAVLKRMVADEGVHGVDVASCGTRVYGLIERDDVMGRIAAEHGYAMGGMAIPMTEELLDSADLIIVMTERHREEITRMLNYDHWNRIVLFNKYCFGYSTDLLDPHFQTEYVYRQCFEMIERGCREIIGKTECLGG